MYLYGTMQAVASTSLACAATICQAGSRGNLKPPLLPDVKGAASAQPGAGAADLGQALQQTEGAAAKVAEPALDAAATAGSSQSPLPPLTASAEAHQCRRLGTLVTAGMDQSRQAVTGKVNAISNSQPEDCSSVELLGSVRDFQGADADSAGVAAGSLTADVGLSSEDQTSEALEQDTSKVEAHADAAEVGADVTRLKTESQREAEPSSPAAEVPQPCSAADPPVAAPEDKAPNGGTEAERAEGSAGAKFVLLVPCRVAMKGRFPLHGTYFQTNEVFLDHSQGGVQVSQPLTRTHSYPEIHYSQRTRGCAILGG